MENLMKTGCKAVVYTRAATREVTELSKSLIVQRRQCEQYAVQHNMEITGYFGGFFSSTAERKQDLQRMLTHLAEQHPEVPNVIVVNAERISRNFIEYHAFEEQLTKMGGSIHFVFGNEQMLKFLEMMNNIKG